MKGLSAVETGFWPWIRGLKWHEAWLRAQGHGVVWVWGSSSRVSGGPSRVEHSCWGWDVLSYLWLAMLPECSSGRTREWVLFREIKTFLTKLKGWCHVGLHFYRWLRGIGSESQVCRRLPGALFSLFIFKLVTSASLASYHEIRRHLVLVEFLPSFHRVAPHAVSSSGLQGDMEGTHSRAGSTCDLDPPAPPLTSMTESHRLTSLCLGVFWVNLVLY